MFISTFQDKRKVPTPTDNQNSMKITTVVHPFTAEEADPVVVVDEKEVPVEQGAKVSGDWVLVSTVLDRYFLIAFLLAAFISVMVILLDHE